MLFLSVFYFFCICFHKGIHVGGAFYLLSLPYAMFLIRILCQTTEFVTINITINMLHPHNLQYATPTNKQIFKYMLYLHFALVLVTILNLCSKLKFRTDICVYTNSLPPRQNIQNSSTERLKKNVQFVSLE